MLPSSWHILVPGARHLVRDYGDMVHEYKFDARVSYQVIELSCKEMNGFLNSFTMDGKNWDPNAGGEFPSNRACGFIKKTIKGTYASDKPWWRDVDCARDYVTRYQEGNTIDESGDVRRRQEEPRPPRPLQSH